MITSGYQRNCFHKTHKKKTFKCSLLRDKSEKEKNNRELSRTCNLELSETSDRQVVKYKEESY